MVTVRTPSEVLDKPNHTSGIADRQLSGCAGNINGAVTRRFRRIAPTARLSLLTMECPLLGDYGR